jgi:hypothetical protein
MQKKDANFFKPKSVELSKSLNINVETKVQSFF